MIKKFNFFPIKSRVQFQCPKIFLIMKLSFILSFVGMLQVAASVYSQNSRLTGSFNNMSVKEVLDEIENNTEYRFFYNENFIDLRKKVSIQANNSNINEFLDKLFASADVSYRVLENNLIVITPKELLQQLKVKGKVVDATTGEPLPGVNVVVEGTTTGTITDVEGYYEIEIPDANATLRFSFIGYDSKVIAVEGMAIINVQLQPSLIELNEVVVTALGIERKKRTLSYATQQVEMGSLTTIKDVSLGNALAGKIAGVSVTSSSGASGVGGGTRIIIRGERSINGDNTPLIVIDGVPSNTSLDAINADDVESINVLKGAAASALYGSNAANGVIVVTTKRGKAGETKIEINSLTTFDIPYLYPPIQNIYGQGEGGLFLPTTEYYSWGAKMEGQMVTDWTGKEIALTPQPNNIKDFFRTGVNYTNSLSYSAGTQKTTAYFSYTNTSASGVIPVNDLERHNFNLRLNTELIDKLKMDFVITWIKNSLDNAPVSGDDLFSPMWQLIKMPRSIRTDDIKGGSYYDETGSLKQLTWAPNSTAVINPYWSIKGREAVSNRSFLNTISTLRYDLTPWMYIQLRGRMSTNNSDFEEKYYFDTKYVNSGRGQYSLSYNKTQFLNGDLLVGIDKSLSELWEVNATFGAEIKDTRSSGINAKTGELVLENKFFLGNGATLSSTDFFTHTQTQSIFGTVQFGFHNYAFVEVTGRNDWNSTLPAPYDYFYPSVGITGVVSEMLSLPQFISFLKIRGSYAEVGNGAGFAQIFQTFSRTLNGTMGEIYPNSRKVPSDLIPERTKSWEAGTEARFLNDRIGMDLTLYKSNTYNQLVWVTAPPSAGYSTAGINCGNIQNQGIELMIMAMPLKMNNFSWRVNVNFSRNWNKVIELTETLNRYEISSPNLSLGDSWIIAGKEYGEILSKGFVRNPDGKIIVDNLGMPKITAESETYLGNYHYKWRSSLTNSVQFKNWSLYCLVDLNYGGVRQSATEAMMMLCGTSSATLDGRDGFIFPGVREIDNGDGTISYVENDIVITAERYAKAVGGRATDGCAEVFNHKATNARLRELAVGYNLPLKSKLIKSMQISAVGRNLFYLYNGCNWFDPDGTYDLTTNGQGSESAFLPGTRNLGFNIKVTF